MEESVTVLAIIVGAQMLAIVMLVLDALVTRRNLRKMGVALAGLLQEQEDRIRQREARKAQK